MHPKMADRIATTYIKYLRQDGEAAAKTWAMSHLKKDPNNMQHLADALMRRMKKNEQK